MNRIGSLVLVAAASLSLHAASADSSWPAWRGPDATGVAAAANPPTTRSETRNIKWKPRLAGDGSDSSPIVCKDRIFFQTAVKTDKVVLPPPSPTPTNQAPPPPAGQQGPPPGDQAPPPPGERQGPPPGDRPGPPPGAPGQRPPRGGMAPPAIPTNIFKFNLVCVDRNSGKTLWEKTAAEALPLQGHHPDHGFASFSPVTDGKRVWANFGSQGLYCYDFDGNLVWKRDLVKLKSMFGEAGSLALAGNAVVVVADNDLESWIFSFNKDTGDLLWKKRRDEKSSFSTPLVVTSGGAAQIITGASRVRSYDAKTGDIVWECDKTVQNGISTPVASADLVFFANGTRGSGALQAVNLGKTGILADTNALAWQSKDVVPFVASPLLYGPRIYFASATPARLSCFDAKTGKPYYSKQPLDQFKDIYASPVGAADKVYLTGRNGLTYVLKNADTFEILATNKLDDAIDCTPAIAGNELFLKGKQYLYCVTEFKQ